MSVKKTIINKNIVWIILILLIGLIIRYFGLSLISNDMSIFLIPWYDTISQMSFQEALSTQVGNYSVEYQLIIFFMTRMSLSPVFFYKLLSIIFDIILSVGVYAFTMEVKNRRCAVWAMALTFLCPTVWMNSAFWGQCDSIYCAFLIWALYFLYLEKNIPAFALVGVAFSFKLQTVFLFPFLAYFLLDKLIRKKQTPGKSLFYILLIPVTWIILALPNFIAGKSFKEFLSIYLEQINTNPEMTLNYPGFWGMFNLDYDTWKLPAILLTGAALLILMVWFLRKKVESSGRHFIWCAFILTYTTVFFLPAMHERYGFLYEILAIILVLTMKRGYLKLFLLQAVTCKTYFHYLWGTQQNFVFLSILQLLIYGGFLVAFALELKGKYRPVLLFTRTENVNDKTDKRFPVLPVLIVTGVFFLLDFFQLGSYKSPETGMVFNEENEEESELHFNFDRHVNIDALEIYVGESEKGTVYVFTAENGSWKKVADNEKINTVFNWNKISCQEKTWEISLIFKDAVIREIVLLDADGNTLLPDNADDYPLLFDEQELYNNPPTYYYRTMFDEVYHARTAYEFLQGLSIYENTHPPLGKSLISIGIAIFGMNPFGWRIISLFFGTLLLPVICLLVWRLTKKRNLTILAAVLLATEFMHFVMSRIGTIDIIIAFFVMCMFYFMLAFWQEEKYRYLFLCGISSGLAVATKWTGVYALVGVALFWLCWFVGRIRKEKSKGTSAGFRWLLPLGIICFISFILIPLGIYVISYIPFVRAYPDCGLIEHAISNSKQMLSYHSNVTASHPYASSWYTWLVDYRPLLDSYNSLDGNVSTVATFFNPFTCIGGLACIPYLGFCAVKKKDKTAGILLLMYAAMLVPWMFISRTVFIYQYFICMLILIMIICYSIQKLNFVQENRVIIIIGAVSFLFFVAYYPVLSGFPVSLSYVREILQYLPSWVL